LNILNLLDILEDELEKGIAIPFISKAMVDRDRCFEIIRDIRLNLPEEIKQGEWIKKERQRILEDAHQEAQTIINEAEQRIKAMVDENEIAQQAYQQSRRIIENAQNSAKEIRLGAKEYADQLLQEVEAYLKEQLSILERNRNELNSSR